MEQLKRVVYVIAATALIGSALSNENGGEIGTSTTQGGESSSSVLRDCQELPERPTGQEVTSLLNYELSECIQASNPDLFRLRIAKGIEARRTFFRSLCQVSRNIQQCLIEKSVKWHRCYNNEVYNKVFDVFVDGLQTLLQKGCLENGESLAIIIDGIDRHTVQVTGNNSFVSECIMYGTGRWLAVLESKSSLPTKLLLVNREIQLFKECIIDNIHGDDNFVTVAKELLEEIVANMKCIHPESGTLVLCKTIDESLIDRTNVCPVVSKSENTKPLSLIFDNITERCLYQQNRYTPKLRDATSLQDFQIHFNIYCRLHDIVNGCFTETYIAASLCLDTTQYNTFKLVRGNLKSAFDTGCFGEGRGLANIFYTANLLKNDTDQQNALITCLNDLEATRSTYNDDPSRIYRYYQELTKLRNCVIKKVNGGIEFVEDVNSVVNQLMTKMKCVNPQDGAIVLCETIISN